MRDYDAATAARIADLGAVVARHLVWIEAKNRDTGATEAAGFWNGLDERDFTIGGETRTYTGAGALMSIEPIRAGVGLDVRMHQLALSEITPEVAQAVRGYDARLAPIEVHRALFDPETGALVAEPHRVLVGTVDEISIPDPAEGGSAPLTLTVADASRAGTRALAVRKSDAAQRAVDPTDRGREYAAISGAVKIFWGRLQAGKSPPASVTNWNDGPKDQKDTETGVDRR